MSLVQQKTNMDTPTQAKNIAIASPRETLTSFMITNAKANSIELISLVNKNFPEYKDKHQVAGGNKIRSQQISLSLSLLWYADAISCDPSVT